MNDLFGLDCPNPKCTHDSTEAFRLRRQLLRTELCLHCGNAGKRVPQINIITRAPDVNWFTCFTCGVDWRVGWDTERNDQIFRIFQREAALALMGGIGVDTPKPGEIHVVTRHPTIPPGFAARMVWLTLCKMPKSALYLRRRLGAEALDPTFDLVFQCDFAPGATLSERRNAPQRPIEKEQFNFLIQKVDSGGMIHTYAPIKCQHCGQQMSLKGFNTLSVREVDLGD